MRMRVVRAADDGGQAVVLAEPEALVAELLAQHRQIERVADGRVFARACDRDRLVKD
jgi:hypothetical protein